MKGEGGGTYLDEPMLWWWMFGCGFRGLHEEWRVWLDRCHSQVNNSMIV